MTRIAFLKRRESIVEVLWSREQAARHEASMMDLMIFGRSMVPEPKAGDMILRPYRPRLP